MRELTVVLRWDLCFFRFLDLIVPSLLLCLGEDQSLARLSLVNRLGAFLSRRSGRGRFCKAFDIFGLRM